MYFEYILRVFEYFLVSYDERSFGSRGSVIDAKSDCIVYCIWMQYCWCKIWGFCIWNESILTLPASPLLCLSSPLAKTSEDNYWWDFWINVRKICNSDLYCEMKYLVWGGTRMKMVEIEDLGIRSRWDWRFDDEFVLTLILMTFEGLLLVDIDMMK